jgi:hypothetical protein
LTSAVVVLGLLLLRVTLGSIPSAAVDFLRYRLTYLYVFAATSVALCSSSGHTWAWSWRTPSTAPPQSSMVKSSALMGEDQEP